MSRRGARPKLLIFGILVIVLLSALVAVRGASALAASVLEHRYPPPGTMVPAGEHRLMLYCTGQGSPTVVIEPGMGQDWVSWRFVWPRIIAAARVCVYDRAGYGWSDPGPMPRTALECANDLHAVLSNSRIPPPYVLAAHSFGAHIARLYASRFPESLAGVVLVDPSLEDEPAAPPPPVRTRDLFGWILPRGVGRIRRLYQGEQAVPADVRALPKAFRDRFLVASSSRQVIAERNEFDSLALTNPQVRAASFPRDVPLTVISTAPGAPGPRHAMQAKLAALSLSGRQIFASTSRHSIHLVEPAIVGDAIGELVSRGAAWPR